MGVYNSSFESRVYDMDGSSWQARRRPSPGRFVAAECGRFIGAIPWALSRTPPFVSSHPPRSRKHPLRLLGPGPYRDTTIFRALFF